MVQFEDLKQQADKMKNNLTKQREELRLKSSLFNMEVKDQWNELDKKYKDLMAKIPDIKGATNEVNEDVYSSIQQLNDELKAGYQKIKSSITKH